MNTLLHLLAAEPALATASDSGPLWLLALGPVGAVAVYWGLYVHYRNTDKSHDFERETLVDAEAPTCVDRKVDTRRGTRDRSVDGDNSSRHRERVQRLS